MIDTYSLSSSSNKMQYVSKGDFVRSLVTKKDSYHNNYISEGDIVVVKEVNYNEIIVTVPDGFNISLSENEFDIVYQTLNNPEKVNSAIVSSASTGNINKIKEENTMSMANELNKMFGSITPGMCRLSMNGGIAVKTSGGYKSYNLKTGRLTNCDSFAFDIGAEFFFCIPTNHVKIGDIILINGKPKCVKDVNNDQITVINYENNTIETVLPERHMFMGNMYFYSKIVSPFNTSSKKGGGMKKLMKYAMMSEMMKGTGYQNTTASSNNIFGGMNPMMMMVMMSGGGFSDLFDGIFDDENEDGMNFMEDMFKDDEETPQQHAKKTKDVVDIDEEDE